MCFAALPEDPFHPHAVVQVFQRSVKIFTQDWRTFCKLAACFVATTTILSFVLQVGASFELPYRLILVALLVIYILRAVMLLALHVAVIRATAHYFLGANAPATSTMQYLFYGLKALPRLACSCLFLAFIWASTFIITNHVDAIAPGFGRMLFLFLSIWYFIPISFLLIPTIAVEGAALGDSLYRVFALAENNRRFALCLVCCLGIICLVPHVIEAVIFMSGWGEYSAENKTIASEICVAFWLVVSYLIKCISLLVLTTSAIPATVFYLSIRVEKEGLNVQVLADELVQITGTNGEYTASADDEPNPLSTVNHRTTTNDEQPEGTKLSEYHPVAGQEMSVELV